jgi:serine phosphatase RsbU (regulator of sigma subunit)
MTSWSFHGVRLSTVTNPARRAVRGGDWCESFAVSDDIVALSIGDVCGHGIEKHGAMVAVRSAIRAAATRGCNPAHTLAEANLFLLAYDPGEYATAIFGLLNVRRRTLVFANAGHPPPLLASEQDATFLEFSATDMPLGLQPELWPELHHISVPSAAMLVFYTDGVSEHERTALHGAAQLSNAAVFAYRFPELATAGVIERQMFLTGSNGDDVAILAAWTPPAAAKHR